MSAAPRAKGPKKSFENQNSSSGSPVQGLTVPSFEVQQIMFEDQPAIANTSGQNLPLPRLPPVKILLGAEPPTLNQLT